MPQEVDAAALNKSEIKVLDIANPPTKQIPVMEYPKTIYKHPVDKTQHAISRVVKDKDEEASYVKQGWTPKGHVPEPPPGEKFVGETPDRK